MDEDTLTINTVDMHTGGEPLRIITSGFPEIEGDTILDKRRFVRENCEHLRKLLMSEPRGHSDMYGALLVKPDHENADIAVLFMHNSGYSTMCGHAIIALGRYAVDVGLIHTDLTSAVGEVPVFIQCPCGLVKSMVEICEGKSGKVKFVSVPAFAFALDLVIKTDKLGDVTVDIGYGGAFYVILPAKEIDLDLRTSNARELTEAGKIITEAARNQVKLHHPDSDELAFVYGTIFTDGKDEFGDDIDRLEEPTANVCIFGDGQVDRSPTGSGVAARVAVQFRRQQIGLGMMRIFENGLTGSKFSGKAVKQTMCGDFQAVYVEVSGFASYTGKHSFMLENTDQFQEGFLVE